MSYHHGTHARWYYYIIIVVVVVVICNRGISTSKRKGDWLRLGHWRPQGEVVRVTSRIWLNEEEKRDQEAGLRERLEPRPEGREGGEELGCR